MADKLRFVEDMVMVILRNNIGTKDPNEDDIKGAIKSASIISPLTEDEKSIVEKIIQSKMGVRMDLGSKIINPVTYRPWLSNRRATINPYYWERYRDYMLREKSWNNGVVEKLGDVSDEILNMLGDPEEAGIWKRKGLILGDIQSGKTSTYTALCNKAADAGYKVIILLTGTLETLRKQTQDRIDAGFVGLNSRNVLKRNPEMRFIGVGLQNSTRSAVPFTSIIGDFNSKTLQALNFTLAGFPEPIVLVIKKNKSVLHNLEAWLRTCNTSIGNDKIDLPLLLIDDEADNASVNTRKEDEDPTAINEGIRKILDLFRRSSYVAVTATPFANIFIDPDQDKDVFNADLFPSDFIYALSPPTNYIGSNKIFGEEAKYDSCLETIDDASMHFRSKSRSSHIVPELPLSLREAIGYFFIVNTVRDIKGNVNSHRSMLINVSQFVNVQIQVYDMIIVFTKILKQSIQNYSKLEVETASKNNEIAFLISIWNKFNMDNVTGYEWKTIQKSLFESVMPIDIRLVNQKTKSMGIERLDYEPYSETGIRVIAVGGNSLSRGLTLEGLCVSYFYRNSQMYDTLMQMGRWFGYRDGYEDLCKIWMESDAIAWYKYITKASAELREEIQEMQRVGLTPQDFGLKVRQDITSLFVTSRNKMRNATTTERWISLAAELIETPRLIATKESLLSNVKATNDFIELLINNADICDEKKVFYDVPRDLVADYVREFSSHPRHIPFSSKDLSQYIKSNEQFKFWDVAIKGISSNITSDIKYFTQKVNNLHIKPGSRVMIKTDNCLLISGQRARVGAPGDTKYGLDDPTIKRIEDEFRAIKGKNVTIPDKPYLKIDRKPILLIHIIKIDKDTNKEGRKIDSNEQAVELVGDIPVIGLGLGFPYAHGNQESLKIKYVINKVEERNYLTYEEDDEFDED